jgi:hypothetical protein
MKSAFGVDHGVSKGLPRAMRGLDPADLRGIPKLMVNNQQTGRANARAKAIKGGYLRPWNGETFKPTKKNKSLAYIRSELRRPGGTGAPRQPLP